MNAAAGIILVCGGILCGFYAAFRYSKRVRELCAMESFFAQVHAYLSLEQMATGELFDRLRTHSCAKTLWFIEKIHEALKQGIMFPEAFSASVYDYRKTSAMTNDDFLLLEKTGGLIGSFDLDTQLSGICSLQKMTATQIEEAKTFLKTKGRLVRSAFILSGIAAAILIV